MTLELIDVDAPATVLAHETGTIMVNDNVTTVLWGTALPKYTTQGSAMTVPLSVYAPEDGTAELTLTVTGPAEDPTTTESEALAAGDLKVYGSIGTDMVAMPLTLDAAGQIVGTWNATLAAGYTPVTWYATVAEGAPVGSYAFGVALTGGNTLDPISVVVFAPETHGEQPPDSGEDTTAPVLTVTPAIVTGSTVTFTLTANESPVDFACMLTTNGTAGAWAACTSPVTYTDLLPGDYVFSAKATDKALNVSEVVTRSWTVEPPDTTPPVVTIDSAVADGRHGDLRVQLGGGRRDVRVHARPRTTSTVPRRRPAPRPRTYTDLAPGTYTFSVLGIDEAGNRSAPVVSDPWTVIAPPDTRAPVVTITAGRDARCHGDASPSPRTRRT